MKTAYIVAATRTPVGKGRGQFAQVRADTLLITALRGALAKPCACSMARARPLARNGNTPTL